MQASLRPLFFVALLDSELDTPRPYVVNTLQSLPTYRGRLSPGGNCMPPSPLPLDSAMLSRGEEKGANAKAVPIRHQPRLLAYPGDRAGLTAWPAPWIAAACHSMSPPPPDLCGGSQSSDWHPTSILGPSSRCDVCVVWDQTAALLSM